MWHLLPGFVVILTCALCVFIVAYFRRKPEVGKEIAPDTYIALVENTYMGVGTKRVLHKFIFPKAYHKMDAAWYYLNVLDGTGMLLGCWPLNDMGYVDRTVENPDTSFKPLTHL